ncbi:thiolase family protein [Streptomyces sp. WMMC500]|uniref:thiolase family protein n=1 Tax=Streptomyces sp. WMMC500 TaxID=3015154 RepID=UPI00248B1DED|nr:thiolase family protein [Streptomyces sp. WMMC500]WBB61289.1 thiolase family protein [Streptomyces sp. WMMC500]
MAEAVIVSTARTPIGRSYKGSLREVDAFHLARTAVTAAIDRAGVPVGDIDDLVLAESLQGGGVIGRYVAVEAGMTTVPGLAVNRHCAGGLSAVQLAAAWIRSGMERVVVAGGSESLSTMPRVLKSVPGAAGDPVPWMSPTHPETPAAPAVDMSITIGENTARLAGISREKADAWALASHTRAAASVAAGHFAMEITPVLLPDGSVFDVDEHPRPDTSAEQLAALPLLHPELDGAVITAGNSSGLNDGAAALVLVSDGYAAAHGLVPLGRVVAWASVGVKPERTGFAPALAIPRALERAGLKADDIDLFEINEAFTTVVAAAAELLGIEESRLNVNGSGCGLGHPVAATGARMTVTMLGELRRSGATFGCLAMCAGGGLGSALIVELL